MPMDFVDRPAPLFPPPVQNAFVVNDIDAALAMWTDLGAGPFYRKLGRYDRARYGDRPTSYSIEVALGYWGDIQIELIQPTCHSPSVYREFLNEGREGFHHMLSLVPDLAATRRDLDHAGYEVIGENAFETKGGVIYARSPHQRWPLWEIGELPVEMLDFFAKMKSESADWDGRDPVRKFA